MSHFKLTVVRKDGITHESTFGGWFAETAVHKFFDEMKGNGRTLAAVIYEGVQSPNSSDIVWTPRTSFNIDEA